MKNEDLKKLNRLANLQLDHRLAVLRVAIEAKTRSEAALAALSQPVDPQPGLVGAASDLAAMAYQRWADLRRAEINLCLARQTHEVAQARSEAEIAFGRNEALRGLALRAVRGRRSE